MYYYRFEAVLQKDGWLSPAYVGINAAGIIGYLSKEKPEAVPIETVAGAAIPGFQNAHSHVFQYGMAGQAEIHAPDSQDDFWSWREAMYQCALNYNPDEMQKIATALYQHLLRNGYTAVAEFHYLHHDKDGKPYSNLAEMGERLVAAAATAGIKITLVPVWYQQGNFGQPPQLRQRRFIFPTLDGYFELLDASRTAITHYKDAALGFGVHSLRAVTGQNVIAAFEKGPDQLPFHIHAAEQLKEVDNCTAFYGQRPVEWLLNHLPVNDRFHLVHCTHLVDEEVKQLAVSGANVVLCPGTEGNLGDGIFRLTDFARQGGNWSIGTDSHISLNPLEDLRWLDYTQRLTTHRRNTFANGAATLINQALFAGKRAMGAAVGDYFAIGQPLDAAVYSLKNTLLAQAPLQHLLPAILYTADAASLYGTLVNGKWAWRDEAQLIESAWFNRH